MLQSQTPRISSRASASPTLNRRTQYLAIAGLLGLVVLVAGVVLLLSRIGGGGSANIPATDVAAADAAAPAQVPAPAPAIAAPAIPAPAQPPAVASPTTRAANLPAAPASAAAPASVLAAVPAAAPAATPAGGPTAPPAMPAASPDKDAATGLPVDLLKQIESGNQAMAAGNLLEARTILNRALFDGRLPANERRALRQQLQTINETLVFSPAVSPNDPLFARHTVRSGDNLTIIMRQQAPIVDRRFLARINRMANENALRVGQTIKFPRQPFHAIVHKNDYRMDVYMGPPSMDFSAGRVGPDGQQADWTYIRSFKVGLGESNGTPEGLFVVRPASKLVNPRWVNPRTGEVFEADDPKNPIGEFWVGLDGADERTRLFTGYGIHGTTEPESVGQQRSMGCVRLLPDDVAMVYELLAERVSTVQIIP